MSNGGRGNISLYMRESLTPGYYTSIFVNADLCTGAQKCCSHILRCSGRRRSSGVRRIEMVGVNRDSENVDSNSAIVLQTALKMDSAHSGR